MTYDAASNVIWGLVAINAVAGDTVGGGGDRRKGVNLVLRRWRNQVRLCVLQMTGGWVDVYLLIYQSIYLSTYRECHLHAVRMTPE